MTITPILFVVFTLTLVGTLPAVAAEAAPAASDQHFDNALSLVDALGIEARYADNKALIQKRLQVRLQKLKVEEAAPYFDRVQVFKTSVSDMVNNVFDWQRDRQSLANAYATHFTKEELIQVVTFFQSPAYQKYLSSKNAFHTEFLNISERRNQEVSKQFAQIYADLRTDLLASAE